MRSPARLFFAGSFAVTLAFGLWFVAPAVRACEGRWPAPLDDVYIHANFARATALGSPFSWIADQGYSSGETAPLYPFLLAPAWLLGAREEHLVLAAFVLACAALALGASSLRALLGRRSGPLAAAGAMAWLSVGTLDFTWFSGMEAACFLAATLRALLWAERARARDPKFSRRKSVARTGLWGAAMVSLRPEGALLVALFAILAARGAGTRSALATLLRVGLPGALAMGLVLLQNRLFTGDFASAGARLKLLSSNPFLDDVTRAKELVLNLLALEWKVMDTQMGPASWMASLFPGLALAALLRKETRHAAAACLLGALCFALVVSWNATARYQGFRYYAPALALLLVASALGASALGRSRQARLAGAALLTIPVGLALSRVEPQRAFFARASANVHGQQVELGRRVARTLPKDARVLVGDAGALAYFSGRTTIDALGLGGYHRHPFVRASVQGEAAMLELIERLTPDARPTHLALYPSWFPATTSLFGAEIDHVTITDNVICGSPTKILYRADFAAMGLPLDRGSPPPGAGAVIDEIDVADIESEEEHGATNPTPLGGFTLAKILAAEGRVRLFDAGRIVPAGRVLSFTLLSGIQGEARLTVRGDEGGVSFQIRLVRGGLTLHEARGTAAEVAGRWTHVTLEVPEVREGDRVELRAEAEARVYHAWTGRRDRR